jgi:tol-pal system protein YbgF
MIKCLHISEKWTLTPKGLFPLGVCLLAACAPIHKLAPTDPAMPEIDVLQLKENSDEALKLSQENKLELQSLATKVHELETRMSALGDELANLPVAKLDELTQQMTMMTDQLRALDDRVSKTRTVGAVQAKKELPTFAPTALDSTDKMASPTAIMKTDSIAKAKAGAKPETGAKRETAAKPVARKPPASEIEAQLYKKAFDLYYGRDYAQAILKFEELLQKVPASTYADNCFYWIGECQFAIGNFAKAITGFRKVFTFSETEKADDAQLKLGYCYLRLGERKQAADEFKKVVSLYPDSEYTERAKEELAKLE